ncbi:hypothetical protein D3C85_1330640 [compost metagenome]
MPPPVGEPPVGLPGSGATPTSNLASLSTAVRLPVECHIIAVLPSTKFWRSVPHSIRPFGLRPSLASEVQYWSASTVFGVSKVVCEPAAFISVAPFCLASAPNIQ